MPSSVRVLIDDCVFAANKEGLGEDPVYHHDEALHCKESRIVFFLEIVEVVIFFNIFFKFHLELIDILLLFVELLIVDVFFERYILEFFINLIFFFEILC